MNAVRPLTNSSILHAAARDVLQGEHPSHPSVRSVIGESAWLRLPLAVRMRFADDVEHAEYTGCFVTVRASFAGRLLAFACRCIGTPIAPYVGKDVPATVRLFPNPAGGIVWERCYRFPNHSPSVVTSTKQLDSKGGFVEALPMGLRMPLHVFERDGALHFVSCGYYFEFLGLRIPVPTWLPPGETHVEHRDECDGWFRFTMTVTHRWLGEVYFQTGRFRAASEAT